jgi:tRNA (cmo5U34)-methyltransferase
MSTVETSGAERLFAGPIGAEYQMLAHICPAATLMSAKLGEFVAGWRPDSPSSPLQVLEIGCGTGITTTFLLNSRDDIFVTAVDNEPTMLDQARANLRDWEAKGSLRLKELDALGALRELPGGSVDLVASGYAIHNFLQDYRNSVLAEIFRVLKPGGRFVNGDRYALDDTLAHTRATQDEVRHYFKTFKELGRPDLLEQWIVHLFGDESEDHVMRLGPALKSLDSLGFRSVEVKYREGVNTLLVAEKPLR